MDPIPVSPHKRSLGLYAFGVVAVAVAVVGTAWFAYSNSQAVAAARDSIAAEAALGPRVVVTTVSAGPTTREITLLGDTKPYSTTTLFAKVSGYIKSIRVDKGDTVHAGQVVAEVESAETDSQYASAVSDLNYKTRTAARSHELVRRGDVSQDADEQAQSNMRMAQEAVRNLATMMSYETIKAPYDGTVIGRFADQGALLQSATTNQGSSLPVLMIADNSRLRVGVYVEQRDVAAVHVGDQVEVTDASIAADRRVARITRTAGALDPRTRTLYVETEVDNRDNFLVPGSFAYVTLHVPVTSLPQVPVAALLQRDGAQVVATVANDGAIRFKPIKVASTDGIVANVADGVAAGDRVALNVPAEVTEGTHIRAVLGIALTPRKIIIDCDPGTDDAIALLLAFASSELEVCLVTVVGGNAGLDRTLPNARGLVGLARAGVPVVAGADRPLLGHFVAEPRVHGTDGLGGVRLPDGPPAAPGIAADAVRMMLRAAATEEITLVGIGPATNLALALATEPALAGRISEIVLMTGAWGEGNATPAAEFNAWNDPEALAVVLACGRPVTLVTLELTAQALCSPARLAAMHARGGGACLRAACEIMASVPPSRRLGGAGTAQHDACAIGWLVAPALFTGRAVHAGVDLGEGPGRGRTVIDRWGRLGQPANARLLETLNAEKFFHLLGERIASLP